MNYFDQLQEFIERTERARSLDELAAIFGDAITRLGFRYFSCASHVDPLRPPRRAVVMHSYPAEWMRIYSEQALFRIDPVIQRADQTLRPFSWDAADFRAALTRPQRELLARAADFGIAHGYTIPLHLPWSRIAYPASCSVVPDAPFPERPGYYTAQLMAYHVYDLACREVDARVAEQGAVELSTRERQCLELVAQGKSDWVAGKLLGIAERTVHNHIERAKRRLGVTTRTQAIVHALATRQISFGDVIKSEPKSVTSSRHPHRID